MGRGSHNLLTVRGHHRVYSVCEFNKGSQLIKSSLLVVVGEENKHFDSKFHVEMFPISGGLIRHMWQTLREIAWFGPRVCFLVMGGNDLSRFTPESVCAQIMDFSYTLLHYYSVERVFISSVLDRPWLPGYTNLWNSLNNALKTECISSCGTVFWHLEDLSYPSLDKFYFGYYLRNKYTVLPLIFRTLF